MGGYCLKCKSKGNEERESRHDEEWQARDGRRVSHVRYWNVQDRKGLS